MSAERVIANLLRIAREDLDGARLLNTRGNRNAIYLGEQAAEKIIRAVLTSERIHAGIRHQLQEMVDLVPDENPLKARLRNLQYLSTYATSYRYTTPSGRIPSDPSADEVNTAVSAIQGILDEAAKRFGVELDAVDGPAACWTDSLMRSYDQERRPTIVVEALVTGGVLEPVADRDDDARLWMDCDLCSFVQNRCDVVLSPEALTDRDRESWTMQTMSNDERLFDPRRDRDYFAPFWLVDDGRRAGTVALELSTYRQFVPAHSLFVFSTQRSRGIAYRALRSIDAACKLGGFEGVLIDTHWSWQSNVRRYLRGYRMWARSFKRSLQFAWADLPPHVIRVADSEASIAIELDGDAVPLIMATRHDDRLG